MQGYTSITTLSIKRHIDNFNHASFINVLTVDCTKKTFVTFVDECTHIECLYKPVIIDLMILHYVKCTLNALQKY